MTESPNEVSPNEVSPNEVSPNEVSPNDVSPNDVSPNDVSLSVEDRLALHELPGRYGDSIDDRNWDLLRTIFTGDGVFDLTGVGSRVCTASTTSSTSWSEKPPTHART